jgi:signal transduction histidine kinase
VASILVVSVAAAVIVSQRRLTATTREYAARQVAALEEERGRVARELHDDVSQQIAVLSLRLDAIHETLQERAADEDLAGATEEIGDGLRDLAASVRAVAHRMHPSALEHLGLGPALQGLTRETAAASGFDIDVQIAEPVPELEPPKALALYRVVQEALRNVRKHANARRVLVRLEQIEGWATLEVTDDGAGFSQDRPKRSDGLGLLSMRERMRLIGGELSVISVPGQGTTVRARIPYGGVVPR